jgi:hypothetical protein
MPLQNRVDPFGVLFRTPARGTIMGNRGGCIHNDRREIVRPFQSRRWIACVLQFKDRHRVVMTPRRYTELFFLDEAVALAAGHRPCAECRREDYVRFMEIVGETRAGAIDERLHVERLGTKPKRDVASLPDGAFALVEGDPWLIRHGQLRRWTPGGYTERRPASGRAELLTPPTMLAVLTSGWNGVVPLLHPSVS